MGTDWGIASKVVNLKRVFDDAVRQQQWKMEQDHQQQKSGAYQSFYNSGISQGVMDVPGAISGYDQAMSGNGQSPSSAATMAQAPSDTTSSASPMSAGSPNAGTLPNGEKLLLGKQGVAQKEKYQGGQDKLEKQYTDRLDKAISYRSGGLGLQDSKVNQAIDLKQLVQGYRDPKTGTYNVPPSMHTELVLGLARLLSPTGQVGVQLEQELRQKTAREGLAGALIYMGFDPKKVGGPTQNVVKAFIDTIDRQGKTAEQLREKYLTNLRNQFPSNLNEESKKRLEATSYLNSYNDQSDMGSGDNQSEMTTKSGNTFKRIQ